MSRSTALVFREPACCSVNCKAIRRSNCLSRTHLQTFALKEQDNVKDWRVKQMVDTCHVYYSTLWSRGDLATADTLLDPQFVHRDLCSAANWGPQAAAGKGEAPPSTGMVVGPRALKALVADIRRQYPDYYVEVEDLAVSDSHRIFVSWVSHGTQLGSPQGPSAASATRGAATAMPPSHHHSLVRGVDVITFNMERSRMLEVNVFRQLSSDERKDVERRLAPGPLEIRLARLHWDT